jgi:tetratricopeptide (TPR) repeat protein
VDFRIAKRRVRKGGFILLFWFTFCQPAFFIPSQAIAQATQHQEFQSYTFARKAFEDGLYDITIQEGKNYLTRFPQGQLKDRVIYLIGMALYYQGKLSEAEPFLARVKKEFPKSPIYFAALYRLGQIHFETQQYNSAIREFKELEQHGGPSWQEPAMFLLGSSHLQANNYQVAAQKFKQLLTLAPQSPKAYEYHFRYGKALFALKDYQGAAKEFRQALDTIPTSVSANLKADILYKLGQAFFQNKNYKEAVKILISFVKHYPAHKSVAEAWYLMALSEEKGKNYPAANEAYAQIIKNFPKSKWYLSALARRGHLSFKRGNYTSSIRDYIKLTQTTRKPKWLTIAYYMLGENYWVQKDYPAALKYYSKVIASPGDKKYLVSAYFKRALCYYHTLQYQQTLKDLEVLAKKQPKPPILGQIWYLRGQTYLQLGDYTRAVRSYEEFLRIRPQDPKVSEVLLNLGLARKKQKDLKGAQEAWEKLVAQEKKNRYTYQAYLQLGLLYYQESSREKAKAALTKATQGPGERLVCEARYWLAELYFEVADYSKGLQELEKIFKITKTRKSNPWLGMAYSKAGSIYEMMGKKEKARATYLMVPKVSEDKELIALTSQRLKALEARLP